MTEHRERRRLPYSVDEMYDLVAAVDRYPEFLPWCSSSRIIERRAAGNREILIADVSVSFKVYRERFRSEVTLDRAEKIIRSRYIDGPFRHLENEWRFTPDGESWTIVDFHVDFEFKNRALQLLIGLLFEEAVRRMVAAFEGRARVLYGRRIKPPRSGA